MGMNNIMRRIDIFYIFLYILGLTFKNNLRYALYNINVNVTESMENNDIT